MAVNCTTLFTQPTKTLLSLRKHVRPPHCKNMSQTEETASGQKVKGGGINSVTPFPEFDDKKRRIRPFFNKRISAVMIV